MFIEEIQSPVAFESNLQTTQEPQQILLMKLLLFIYTNTIPTSSSTQVQTLRISIHPLRLRLIKSTTSTPFFFGYSCPQLLSLILSPTRRKIIFPYHFDSFRV